MSLSNTTEDDFTNMTVIYIKKNLKQNVNNLI